MSVKVRQPFPKPVFGFTMVELLLVITTVGIISIVALPKFLDFRTEARVATAQNYINHARSALANKKTQMALRCGSTTWPRLEAILMNDITEGGAPEASCTPAQLPDGEERKFFAQASITPPTNPYNLLDTVVATSCTDFCTCEDVGGFLYNQSTGEFGHPLLLEECRGRLPASVSSETSESSSENASSDSSESSEESSSSGPCEPSYAMDEELELCQDVACDEGYVELSYCEGGGEPVSCEPLSTYEWDGSCNCGANAFNCTEQGGPPEGDWTGVMWGYDPQECENSIGTCPYGEEGSSDSSEGGFSVNCSVYEHDIEGQESSDGFLLSGTCATGVLITDGPGYNTNYCNDGSYRMYFGSAYAGETVTLYQGSEQGSATCPGDSGEDSGYGGCTDGGANNYDSGASYDDGTCTYDDSGYGGCTDGGASNYDSGASYDDGSCTYDDPGYGGCTDGAANNYDSGASFDDGSCTYDEADGGDSECPYGHNDGSCDSLPECPGLDYGNIFYAFQSGVSGSTTFAYWGYTVTGCSTTVGISCSCDGGSCTLSWDGSEEGGSGSISLYGDGCVRKDFLYQQ